jgi:outer membrane receptor protein involved in Fe transport
MKLFILITAAVLSLCTFAIAGETPNDSQPAVQTNNISQPGVETTNSSQPSAETLNGSQAPEQPQASAPEGGKAIQTEQVVVSATRTEQKIQDLPQSVSVITSDQIRNTPAQELDDVLGLVPGIDLLGYSGEAQHPTSDAISMRGLGGTAQGISRALVMVDGIPINDPFFGYIQWGRVPLENIDRVEIVRGGGSPLWGNYAEGGVINIITKEPTSPQTILNGSLGSYLTYDTSLYQSFPQFGSSTLQLFAQNSGTDGFQQVPKYERAPFNVPTTYNAKNIQIKDSISVTDEILAHVTLYLHENHQQLETVLDSNSQDMLTVTGDIKKLFENNASLTATLFYTDSAFQTNNSTYFPDQTDLAATTQSLNEIHHVTTSDVGGSLIWSQRLPGILSNYMFGMDFRTISGNDNTNHFIATDFSAENVSTRGHGDQTFIGGFAQATLTPINKLTIIGSGRYQVLENTNGYDGSLGGVGAVPNKV